MRGKGFRGAAWERGVYFRDGMEGFSAKDKKGDLRENEERSEKKCWKGFEKNDSERWREQNREQMYGRDFEEGRVR